MFQAIIHICAFTILTLISTFKDIKTEIKVKYVMSSVGYVIGMLLVWLLKNWK